MKRLGDELFRLPAPNSLCYYYSGLTQDEFSLLDQKSGPPSHAGRGYSAKFRFPFPLGKGLGVRLSGHHDQSEKHFLTERSYRWVVGGFEFGRNRARRWRYSGAASIPALFSTAIAHCTSDGATKMTPRSLMIPPTAADRIIDWWRVSQARTASPSGVSLSLGGDRKIRMSYSLCGTFAHREFSGGSVGSGARMSVFRIPLRPLGDRKYRIVCGLTSNASFSTEHFRHSAKVSVWPRDLKNSHADETE